MELVQHAQAFPPATNRIEPAVEVGGAAAEERKKSPGALCPHAFTATTRTHALKPGGSPDALTVVAKPTFETGAMFDAPGDEPAERM
jgi:hypothetical protein